MSGRVICGMKIDPHRRFGRVPVRGGFSLLELVIVISIIALLAALLLNGLQRPPPPKPQVTKAAKEAIQSALERYHDKYGEYPESLNPDETAEVLPGKTYRIGGARCLYQALTGDGSDAIKGAERPENGESRSDGQISTDEIKAALFRDMPSSMWRKVGDAYILVDGFSQPFQYVKADPEKGNAINPTYDLWSVADDDKNVMLLSKNTESDPALSAKWIKNW